MLKRNTYDDFGQFVAAIKAAERLGLSYCAERKEVRWITKPLKRAEGLFRFPMFPPEIDHEAPDEHHSAIEYVLELHGGGDDDGPGEA